MNEEKQIEEMANILVNGCKMGGCEECKYSEGVYPECALKYTADKLYTAGYRKQEWISVDERLPDEDGEYLTWDGLVYFLIWFNASLGLWNVSEGGDTSSAIRDVTHWMPLPEAPKMKGGAE